MIAFKKPVSNGLRRVDGTKMLVGAAFVLNKMSRIDVEVLEKVLGTPQEYMDHPAFHDEHLRREVEMSFQAPEDMRRSETWLLPVNLLEESDRTVSAFSPLSGGQEMRMFLKLNFARYRICQLIRMHQSKPLSLSVAKGLVRWRKEELVLRGQITQANIPLVLAMAKKMHKVGAEFTELVSEGNMALLRSVDKFDCARGFKFSTYACRAILKSFARVAMQAQRYRNKFPVEFDPDLEKSTYLSEKRDRTRIACVDRLRDILDHGGPPVFLNGVEKAVIRARFGIDEHETKAPMTLEEVGKAMGVSKERVRQIQEKAMRKLRVVLEEHVLNC